MPHVAPDGNEAKGWWDGSIGVLPTVGPPGVTQVIALTLDYPMEAARASQIISLSDAVDDGYRLRRIVGKCFVSLAQNIGDAQTTFPTGVLVSAGFIVLRVDEQTGAPLRLANLNAYDPLELDNTSDPWVWRRTWMLSNPLGATSGVTVGAAQFPRANTDYGSASDGPHIDQATARRVSKEERLFFVISAHNVGDASTSAGDLRWWLDFRILSSPMKIMGNKRNASR